MTDKPNPLVLAAYTCSESHLSGYRLVIGFETLEQVQDAHQHVVDLARDWIAKKQTGLLPCPWCRSSNVKEFTGGGVSYVQCLDCTVCGPDHINGKHWNSAPRSHWSGALNASEASTLSRMAAVSAQVQTQGDEG